MRKIEGKKVRSVTRLCRNQLVGVDLEARIPFFPVLVLHFVAVWLKKELFSPSELILWDLYAFLVKIL